MPRKAPRSGVASLPDGATPKSTPRLLKPVLATLVDGPPKDADAWLYEVKCDGYRILARIDADGGVRDSSRVTAMTGTRSSGTSTR